MSTAIVQYLMINRRYGYFISVSLLGWPIGLCLSTNLIWLVITATVLLTVCSYDAIFNRNLFCNRKPTVNTQKQPITNRYAIYNFVAPIHLSYKALRHHSVYMILLVLSVGLLLTVYAVNIFKNVIDLDHAFILTSAFITFIGTSGLRRLNETHRYYQNYLITLKPMHKFAQQDGLLLGTLTACFLASMALFSPISLYTSMVILITFVPLWLALVCINHYFNQHAAVFSLVAITIWCTLTFHLTIT